MPNLLLAKVHSVSHFLKILKANKLLVKNGHQASAQWAPLYREVNPAKGNVTLTRIPRHMWQPVMIPVNASGNPEFVVESLIVVGT